MVQTKLLATLNELSNKALTLESNAAVLREGCTLAKDTLFLKLLSELGFSLHNIEEDYPLHFNESPIFYIELTSMDPQTISYPEFCNGNNLILEDLYKRIHSRISLFTENRTLKLYDIHFNQSGEPINGKLILQSITITLVPEQALKFKKTYMAFLANLINP